MSLPVPLTVRVGDQHITKQVQSLSFRKEAIGGVRAISFGLSRSLIDLNGLDPLAKVYVYDGRSGETVAQGRFADPGRSASGDGQRWDCVAFGPAQHASDITAPLVYVDRDLSAWSSAARSNAAIDYSSGTKPDVTPGGTPGLVFAFEQGSTAVTNDYADMRYTRVRDAGMKLGGFAFDYDQGLTAADLAVTSIISTNGSHTAGFYDNGPSYTWTTAGGTGGANVVTNFANGRDVIDFRNVYTGAGGVVAANWWSWAGDITVRGMVYNQSGTEVTSGYVSNPYMYASDVVKDLLGRGLLPQFDKANATVAASATTQITQLVYENGVTPAQVLEDMMGYEPAYRWTTGPDVTGLGYAFRWELWPTTVRYEATLDDGGSFPLSTQDVYNRVWVQYVNEYGQAANILRTMACEVLDGESLVRQAFVQLPSGTGTLVQAEAAATAFLTEHNVPKNSGTLTVARPIRDVVTGRMVQPWEIEPGELVRVKGVEAYPDAFNADTNDGQGVFRIHAADYASEGNAATLALDADARDTEDALVKLLNQRSRR